MDCAAGNKQEVWCRFWQTHRPVFQDNVLAE